MMRPSRRKKWTEAEERTLIDRYGEMVSDGTLAKMKTREKKYKPIALHVNSVHHSRDPITYPSQWTWKDVSTKVQNMRHQYALVKQKIKKPESNGDLGGGKFDWMEGPIYWSNFLRYKEVFGDVDLVFNSNDSMIVADGNDETGGGFDGTGRRMEIMQFGYLGHDGDGDFGAGIDGVMGLEYDYDGEVGEGNYKGGNSSQMKEDGDDGFVYEDIEPSGSYTKKKRKILKGWETKTWGFLANQLGQLKEMESRFEQREVEREQERQKKERLWMETKLEHDRKWEEREKEREEWKKTRDKLRRQQIQEWEAIEKERRRTEEELIYEKEWEERMNRRRSEWKKRIDGMLSRHREELEQMQTRILHEQHNLTSQLLGIFSQWAGHATGLTDHTGVGSHYLSQMIQNLHHVNGIVHDDTRVEGHNQEDEFIVDG